MNTTSIERARASATTDARLCFLFGILFVVFGVGCVCIIVSYPFFKFEEMRCAIAVLVVSFSSTQCGYGLFRHWFRLKERVQRLDKLTFAVDNDRSDEEISQCLKDWTSTTGPDFLNKGESNRLGVFQQFTLSFFDYLKSKNFDALKDSCTVEPQR